jgi:high affinity sulfate transporter 1
MATAINSKKEGRLARYFPIVNWLPEYQKTWLRPDFIAGLTVLALLIPEGMAYAEIAGLPPQTAFYAAPAGLLLYAIFGTSRQLVVAVSAAIATMSAATVAPLAAAGSPEYAALSAGLAILAGLVSIIAGFLRLGRITSFFSEPVLTGFITGLALTITIKQVPKFFGFEGSSHGNFWQRTIDIIRQLSETHLLTLFIGLAFFALILFLEHRFPKVPAALAALVLGILGSVFFNFHGQGVHVVGDIPAGLVAPKFPGLDWQDWLLLLGGALGLSLINFAEAYGPARSFAAKHSYSIRPNQELIGLGAANVGAGLFQGFPIGSSLSKSAANDRAGAQTSMALIICAGLTIIVALFFTPFFGPLPEAVLAAVVVVAVIGQMKFRKIRDYYMIYRRESYLAIIAMLGVLTFEPLAGLLIAVILSLLALVWRASQSKYSILGWSADTLSFDDVSRHPDNRAVPGMLILRPDEKIFFVNAQPLRNEIIRLAKTSDPPTETVLLNLELSNELDVTGFEMLIDLKEELQEMHITLMLARVNDEVKDMFERIGVIEKFGQENIIPRVVYGVRVYLKDSSIRNELRNEFISEWLLHTIEILSAPFSQMSDEQRTQLEDLKEQLQELALEIGNKNAGA